MFTTWWSHELSPVQIPFKHTLKVLVMACGQSFHRENSGPIYRDEAECAARRIFWGELLLRFRMAGNKSNNRIIMPGTNIYFVPGTG